MSFYLGLIESVLIFSSLSFKGNGYVRLPPITLDRHRRVTAGLNPFLFIHPSAVNSARNEGLEIGFLSVKRGLMLFTNADE